jgi:hypothetical protein
MAARTNNIVSPCITATSDGARFQKPEEQRRRDQRQRLKGAEERNGDGIEAEAERKTFNQPIVNTEDFDAAGETSQRSAQQHDVDGDARHREARIQGRRPAGAGDADGEPERRAPQQHVCTDGGDDGNRDADMELGARPQLGQPHGCRQQRRLRKTGTDLPQRAVQCLTHDEQCDEVQQERYQDLVHAARQLDDGG